MWGMITALVSGALMSIQGVFNSAVMKQTSMWVSAGWVQISAFVVCLLMWLFTGRGAVSGLWQIEPRYMLTGGVIGAFITYTVIKSFDALGPAKSALLIVVAQGDRGGGCDCGDCDFQMGIKIFCLCLKGVLVRIELRTKRASEKEGCRR